MLPLFGRIRDHASRLALIAPEGRFSYAELDAGSTRVARALLGDRSDLAEARVAHLLPPGFAWTTVQLGIWRAGGITVPLPMAQPKRELLHLLRDSQPEVVVCDRSLAGPLGEAASELGIALIAVSDVLDRRDQREAGGLPALAAERGAMILYTSGTTGPPKGVLTTHANLEAQAGSLIEAWRWSADDHVLLVLPLHHVHGILNVVTCALWAGARCTAHPRFEPLATWEALASGELTLFMAVPTIYQRLLAAWDAATAEVRARWSRGASDLRLMVSGSAALPVRVLERWQDVTGHRLLERYGMTEIGMGLSNPLVGERRAGHVGAPLPRVQVRLADESGGTERTSGPGEVQIKGPTVFREYWRRPEETRAAFTRDGWFRTGDVAVCEQGSYRMLGRASVDIVKSGGEKVSALEVEEVLREHPAIGDCAVVGVSDADWGERLCAAVVTASGETPLTLADLREWARARLAIWKIPRDLSLVEALPRNAMGKVDKKAVRSLFPGGA